MDKFQLILAYDGDNAGRLVGRAVLADDPKSLSEVSHRIELGHEIVKRWAQSNGGTVISGGGDEGTFQVPQEALENIEQLRKDYQFATGLTMTVGVGSKLSEAGKALMVGKFRGKDQVVQYDQSVESDIVAAQQRLSEGSASQEENKLGEAYLKNEEVPMADQELHDCPYCKEIDGQGDADLAHCKYCHEMDAATAEGHDDCPYCAEADQAEQHEGVIDDCPYCKEGPANPEAHAAPADVRTDAPAPQGTNEVALVSGPGSQTQNGDSNAPAAPVQSDAPLPGDSTSALPPAGAADQASPGSQTQLQGPIVTEAAGTAAPLDQEIDAEDDHSAEAMDAIVREIAGSNIDGTPGQADAAQADSMDDAALVDSNMTGNVSHPAGYQDNNVPTDMALSDEQPESPDLSEVLQGGLDSHADNMQRDKVVQMVSAALEGFKASKGVLEKAKAQAPQLYQASIQMLKAMIEMANMLGLGQEGAEGSAGPIDAQGEQVVNELGGGAAQGGDQWADPFPKHPDHGGQAKPGHAASKEGAAQAPQQ